MTKMLANIRQRSTLPVFLGTDFVADDLMCSAQCGQVLVKNFREDCFAGVRIECFSCGNVTETPPFPLGEIIPPKPLLLDEGYSFALERPVEYTSAVTIAAEAEIEKAIVSTSPREVQFNLDMSSTGLKELGTAFVSDTGADLELQKRIVARGGVKAAVNFPFAWAVTHLADKSQERSAETLKAIEILRLYGSLSSSWSDHPRYGDIAPQLAKPGSYYHTIFAFMAALHLFRTGNKIGLSLEDKRGEPNPDLYIRNSKSENLYLEVKSPDTLQSTGPDSDPTKKLEGLLKETVKRSSGQINLKHPGVLIIGSSYIDRYISAEITRCRENTIKSRGRLHRGLAGIVTIATHLEPSAFHWPNVAYDFAVSVNPHFEGLNPISDGSV